MVTCAGPYLADRGGYQNLAVVTAARSRAREDGDDDAGRARARSPRRMPRDPLADGGTAEAVTWVEHHPAAVRSPRGSARRDHAVGAAGPRRRCGRSGALAADEPVAEPGGSSDVRGRHVRRSSRSIPSSRPRHDAGDRWGSRRAGRSCWPPASGGGAAARRRPDGPGPGGLGGGAGAALTRRTSGRRRAHADPGAGLRRPRGRAVGPPRGRHGNSDARPARRDPRHDLSVVAGSHPVEAPTSFAAATRSRSRRRDAVPAPTGSQGHSSSATTTGRWPGLPRCVRGGAGPQTVDFVGATVLSLACTPLVGDALPVPCGADAGVKGWRVVRPAGLGDVQVMAQLDLTLG